MTSMFYVMNEKKERWSLNSPSTGVFTNPEGFGIAYNSTYLKVGDMWRSDSNKMVQPAPKGNIVFPENQYKTFQEFIQFVNHAKELVLVYQPSGIDTEYFADIDIVKIEKSGYHNSTFNVPIEFICKSLFYTEEKFEYHIEKASQETRFNFRWNTRFNDLSSISFDFVNDGHVDSPFELSFNGYCLNPEIVIFQGGEIVHQVKFKTALEATSQLIFSTFDDDLFVEIDGENSSDCLDFTNNNFFKLPIGESRILFRAEAGKANNILLNLEKYYKAV